MYLHILTVYLPNKVLVRQGNYICVAKIIFLLQKQILSRLQNIIKYGGYLDQSEGR